jgi:hypothetical protein
VEEPAGVAIALDALTFFVAVGLVLRIGGTPGPDESGSGIFGERKEGVAEVLRHRWYWATVVAHAFWNAGLAIFLVLGPVTLADEEGGPVAWGAMGASIAVGGVLGGLLLLKVRFRRSLLAANLSGVPAALCLLVLIPPAPVPVLLVTALVMGIGTSMLNGVWRTAVQTRIPSRLLGRVTSLDWMLSLAIMPLGYVVAGQLTGPWGSSAVLGLGAGLMAVPLALTAVIPKIRALDEAPLQYAEPSSGPD